MDCFTESSEPWIDLCLFIISFLHSLAFVSLLDKIKLLILHIAVIKNPLNCVIMRAKIEGRKKF